MGHPGDTLRDAVRSFRDEYRLAHDEADGRWWFAQLGGWVIPLPNFGWRRSVIDVHDAHHLVTGYSPTATGELHVAAWELGVRCYADPRARALCLGLALAGLVVTPGETVAAYRKGRSHRAAYRGLTARRPLLDQPRAAIASVLAAKHKRRHPRRSSPSTSGASVYALLRAAMRPAGGPRQRADGCDLRRSRFGPKLRASPILFGWAHTRGGSDDSQDRRR